MLRGPSRPQLPELTSTTGNMSNQNNANNSSYESNVQPNDTVPPGDPNNSSGLAETSSGNLPSASNTNNPVVSVPRTSNIPMQTGFPTGHPLHWDQTTMNHLYLSDPRVEALRYHEEIDRINILVNLMRTNYPTHRLTMSVGRSTASATINPSSDEEEDDYKDVPELEEDEPEPKHKERGCSVEYVGDESEGGQNTA
ncbi:hypothetical protein KCU92_g4061, partial [Aureobasidium melanogenum]